VSRLALASDNDRGRVNPEKLLTQREVCELLQISPKSLQKLRREGRITYIKFAPRCLRFRQEDVRRFIQLREKAAGKVVREFLSAVEVLPFKGIALR
jgi:excisionase family DNA binding protein